MQVRVRAEAVVEFNSLGVRDRVAMRNALRKLEVAGDQLRFPHSSAVRAETRLRELRPLSGRSRWRAFYRRIGDTMVVAAFGPEAQIDPPGFARAVARAAERLADEEASPDG